MDLGNKPDEFKRLYASVSPDRAARAKVPILEVLVNQLNIKYELLLLVVRSEGNCGSLRVV